MLRLGMFTKSTWLRLGKHLVVWFGLKYMFWSSGSPVEMVRPPLKNGRFWSDKNGWKRPQVSLKISNGVT